METAKQNSRDTTSVAGVLSIEASLLTNHIQEIIEQAEAYLDELRAATAAARERLRSGLMRLRPQAHADHALPDQPTEVIVSPSRPGLVDFGAPETNEEGVPTWKETD